MAAKKVYTAAERKAQLLDVGAKLAAKHGPKNVTRRMIATQAKVGESLVNNYLGDRAKSQAAIKRHAIKLGLTLPTAEREAAIGTKLRAHGPRDARDTRKRSAKEVKAIVKKTVSAPKKKTVQRKVMEKPAPSSNKSQPGAPATKPMPGPSETKVQSNVTVRPLAPLPLPIPNSEPSL